MSALAWVLAAPAGALGALARFGTGRLMARGLGLHAPWGVLVVNLPPGAGKSSIISATAPPWILGHRPFERMGIVSAKGRIVGAPRGRFLARPYKG